MWRVHANAVSFFHKGHDHMWTLGSEGEPGTVAWKIWKDGCTEVSTAQTHTCGHTHLHTHLQAHSGSEMNHLGQGLTPCKDMEHLPGTKLTCSVCLPIG